MTKVQLIVLKMMLSRPVPKRLVLRRTKDTPVSHVGIIGPEISRKHHDQAPGLLFLLGNRNFDLLRN